MDADVIVIGAGIAGLTLTRALRDRGARVLVFERSRAPGGRCATRRLGERTVDHGLTFLHGFDEGFLHELSRVDAEACTGWPYVIRGSGPPCQPEAYLPTQQRLAFRDGNVVFGQHLARDLPVRYQAEVTALEPVDGGVRVRVGTEALLARTVVAATAFEQALRLLDGAPADDPVAGPVRKLAWRVATVPCLTVIAEYERPLELDFDILHPGDESPLQAIVVDDHKRRAPQEGVLVLQALPPFSQLRLGEPERVWADELIDAAARDLGDWVRRSRSVTPHRRRFARVAPGTPRKEPAVYALPKGGTLALVGEHFSAEGGVQGAYRAALALADKLSR